MNRVRGGTAGNASETAGSKGPDNANLIAGSTVSAQRIHGRGARDLRSMRSGYLHYRECTYSRVSSNRRTCTPPFCAERQNLIGIEQKAVQRKAYFYI